MQTEFNGELIHGGLRRGDLRSPCFGVAGNPPNFKRSAYRGDTLIAPQWLREIGLDAYEYEAVRGVNVTKERANVLGEAAQAHGITLSLHAPYYTNFASLESETICNSIRHLTESVHAASQMGARVVVLHPGWYKGHSEPGQALERCCETLFTAMGQLSSLDERTLIAPETSGSLAQFGSLEEILSLCRIHPRLIPCLDFAHMHARQSGRLFDADAFDTVFSRVETVLGREKLNQVHVHYYPVGYGPRGEKSHHSFDEPDFGPRPEPFVDALHRWGLAPTVICESRERQDLDALLMKRLYETTEVQGSG